MRACELIKGTRVAIFQEKKILACVVMTDLERAPDGKLYWVDPKFEDLDGDSVPELLGWEVSSQNLYCDYIPRAVFALKAGRCVRDDAAMERWAKTNKVAWWGPEPLIAGTHASHPFMIECEKKKKRLSEGL